ncbi:MAG: hypothetical protein NVS3B21_21660 [Acidimicrobiales bacterium]
MAVTVEVKPSTFTLVSFDAAEIGRLVAEAAGWVGLDSGAIRVDVDESVPLAMSKVTDGDPIVIWVEGGAFEDPKRIRNLSGLAVQTVATRLLARIADRRRPGFGEAPAEDALSVAEIDAWDVWAMGRAARRGLDVNQQRWRYRFRNRYGFSDAADRIFDHLWVTEDLTWADLAAAAEHKKAPAER